MKRKEWALLASVILLPGGSLLGAYWIYKKLKRGNKTEVPEETSEKQLQSVTDSSFEVPSTLPNTSGIDAT